MVHRRRGSGGAVKGGRGGLGEIDRTFEWLAAAPLAGRFPPDPEMPGLRPRIPAPGPDPAATGAPPDK